MWSHVLHHHHGRFRRVREASAQLVEADTLTALGGAINRAHDGVAGHRRLPHGLSPPGAGTARGSRPRRAHAYCALSLSYPRKAPDSPR